MFRPTPPDVSVICPGVVVPGAKGIGDWEVMSRAAEPKIKTDGAGSGGSLRWEISDEVFVETADMMGASGPPGTA